MVGIRVAAEVAQEQVNHQHNQHERLKQRFLHLRDGVRDEGGAVVEHSRLQPFREAAGRRIQRLLHPCGGLHGVGARRQVHADRHGRVAVEAAFAVPLRRAQLHARHVAHAQHGAVRVGAHDDGAELLGAGEAPLGLQVDLELRVVAGGPRAHAPNRRLHVLLLDRRHDVRRREVQADEPVRVEPDPHGVVERPEQRRRPDPVHPRQRIEDVDGHVVGDEQRILLAALRRECQELQDGRGALLHRHAVALHLLRQARQRRLHPVVHVDRVDVRVGAQLERHGQRVAAVVARVGLHVDHAVRAVDLRFQRLRYSRLHHGRGCAGVAGCHLHLRRHDVRELRHRQHQQRQSACDHGDDGDHGRKARPVYEDA